ncbi:MAG: T9SS type A sorting domain-containing protein, partial [Chitinophagaceae bacterium]|nr:T9SS type A sorting domain-containing protein [Chitinophagaceae bacterium]
AIGVSPLQRYWIIEDTSFANYNYSLQLEGSATDNFDINQKLKSWNGSSWTTYPGNVYGTMLVSDSNLSTLIYPLHNRELTGLYDTLNSVQNTYVWNGSVNQDYQVAANWTPSRTNPSPFDALVFNNGLQDTVNNIPSQTIRKLSVLNNTVLHFVPSTSYIIYTIQSDNNSTNHELNIEMGSAFMIQGDYFELKFAGNNNTALVSGRLEINDNTAATAKVNFTNCIATVSATGVLAAGGTVGLNPFVSTNTTLKVFGIYENKYTNNVGFYPVATWEDGSEVKVLGLLNPPSTASGSTSGFNQEFYNYTFNCVNLSSSFSFGNLTIDSVRNKFSILSTGSSYISMDTVNTKKFFMSNGQFRPQTVFVQDSLNYSGGQIINPFTSSRFIFNGQQGIQEFSCHDSSFEGAMKYHIQNPNGIHLSGTGAFSTNPSFKIYSGGSIEVNTAATTPISTNLILTYDSVNTTLSYLYKGNLLSDAICYPSLNSPSRLTIDIGNLHHIQLPFSRTIRETLTMTSGNIRLGAFDLTLGKSVTATGSLSYTSGFIESTTGYFYRWYKTTGLSTGAILAYPMGDGSSARKVYMYFSSSTALSTGGTIGVRHTNPGGNTNGLSIADASFIISNRTNANWEFVAGNGITATGTIGLKFEAYGLNLFGTPSDNRITQATAVVGGHVNGSGVMPDVEVQRNNINLAALTAGPFYVGFAGLSSSNLVYSVSSGNWNDPTIWNINAVPNASHVVYISSGTHVAVTTTQAAYNVTVLDGGVLSCISDTIHVEGTITNKGQFLIQGGNVIQGYSGGGDRDFINLDSLSITSGYLEINGMIQSAATFIQTGGVILVDGNSGLSFGNETSHLVQITGNVLATGGLLIIRDPHYYSSGAVFNGGGFDVGHTIQLGDGISNTGGSSGFSFATQGNGVGNLHVLASGVGLNREVNIYAATIVKGNLSLLNPSAVLDCAANLTIGGNLYIDTGAVWYTGNLVTFSLAGSSAIQTQELLSYGSIVNYFSTTNFIGIKFDNISTEGIRCKLGNWSYSGTMNLGNTKLTMEDNSVITGLNSSPTYANGWIHGKLKLNCSTTTTTLNFPIGDSLFASPVSINLNGVVSQSTTTPGYIQMHTLPMDHPLLSSSTINPGASVNRNYVIDTSGGLLFNSGQAQLNFKYNVSDIDAGANVSNFIVAKRQGGNWTNYLSFNPSLYTLSTVLDLNHLEGEYNIGENAQMPIILGQPVDVMVCSNDNAQMVVNASATNSFQWEVNDGSGWIALIASLNYSGTNTNTLQLTNCTTSMNGYLYRCKISNNIGSVYSSIVSLSVGIAFAPVLTISPTTNTLCANDTVTFSTSLTNGGAAPSYDWFINGVSQNLNSPYALFSGLTTNSIIYCTVLSNSTCALPGVVTSNSETITVNPLLNASITISSSLGNSICVGATDTFTALILNGGSDPHYQWKKNGVNVGTDSPIYISNSLGNGNTITCQLTSNENCINSAVVQSNTITMTVSSPVTPNVTISANPGTTICAGTGVTFTAFATNGGSTPQFQWYLNGSLVGTNSNTYTNGGLQNSDQVSCVLVSSVGCVTSTSDTSNILSMVVNPILTPDVTISVNPSDTLCIGSTAIFSSLVTNAGSTISYSWKKNGITVSTSSSYSSSTLANGDEIKLVINTTPQCASTTTDTSNTISMTMVGNVTPSITISNPQGSVICSGDTVVFTANAVNGGSSPIFQWTKNGVNVGSNSNVYSDVGFVNGDLIQCILTSSASCATIVNVSSNTIALTVNPIVTPTIAISASPGNSFCEGANVTFNASITNGGSTPVYSWKKNGIVVGSNMPSYTSTTLANGDIISCTLNSNANCVSANNINSNDILVNVISNTTPSVSITANPGTSITSGQLVTFTATASNAGSTPSYQWKINSVNVGTNSSTYTSSTLMNTDLVQCVVTSSDTCVTSPVASSNNLLMNVSVGVNDVLAWYELPTLYPNPASKVVNLKGKLRTTNHVTLTCNLISSIGQVVMQSRYELSTSTFDIAVPIPQNVSPGIYLVKLQVDKQEFLYRLVVN